MKHDEYSLQKAVCSYLKLQYPHVKFMSDTVASVRLTVGQAGRNKAIQCPDFKTPDLIIFQPNKHFHGLFIELKIDSPYKQNGEIYSDPHLQGQSNTIEDLRKLGFCADFCWSLDQAKSMIDNYLKDV